MILMNNNSRNVIIFDLDGTIIDDKQRYISTFEHCRSKFSIDIDLRKVLSLKLEGLNEDSILEKLDFPKQVKEKISKERRKIIETEEFLRFQKLFSDTKIVLSNLSKNFIMCLATNRRDKKLLEKQLQDFSVFQYFNTILCREFFENKREMIQQIIDTYSVNDDEPQFFFVTDTYKDFNYVSEFSDIIKVATHRGLNSKSTLKKHTNNVFSNLKKIEKFITKTLKDKN